MYLTMNIFDADWIWCRTSHAGTGSCRQSDRFAQSDTTRNVRSAIAGDTPRTRTSDIIKIILLINYTWSQKSA